MEALGFKIWIFAPKSCLFGFKISWFQLFIYFLRKILAPLTFFISCLFTFLSAECLFFRQLIVYIFVSWLFTFVSCLFTIWFFAPKPCFFVSLLPKWCLQAWNVSWLFTFSAVCLHFQLFVYLFVSWNQLFVYFLSADFWIFAPKSCFFGHFFATTDASTL